jgi:hypothetical protein
VQIAGGFYAGKGNFFHDIDTVAIYRRTVKSVFSAI